MVRNGLGPFVGGVCLLAAVSAAFATDPPDAATNPVSGFIETVDCTWNGTSYDVRHVITPSLAEQTISDVATSSSDDLGPKIAISSSGDTYIAWWRDGSTRKVFTRRHVYGTNTWDNEIQVSQSSQSARKPSVGHDGTTAWVAYEFVGTGGATSIACGSIEDSPDPFPTIASTTYGGALKVQVNAESGNLWVTWVDSSSQVGWSEYNYGNATWGSVGHESYASDSVTAARGRIRTTVLGN